MKIQHRTGRLLWLRAAVMGADDGIVSTASLMVGVTAANGSKEATLIAGLAGLVAGAMSMAAGEYVSVSSQADAEQAAIREETTELKQDPEGELEEMAGIYRRRGLDADLAMKVAKQLTAKDPLGLHVRDELGLDPRHRARPVLAAIVSGASFASFALLPILTLIIMPPSLRATAITGVSLTGLALLGGFGGWLGGASILRASLRVLLGGGLAMGVTWLIGHLIARLGS